MVGRFAYFIGGDYDLTKKVMTGQESDIIYFAKEIDSLHQFWIADEKTKQVQFCKLRYLRTGKTKNGHSVYEFDAEKSYSSVD